MYDMFKGRNIVYLIFAVVLVFIANYVGTHFKQHFVDEKDNSAELIQKYLLNDSPLYGFNKPKIWIHTKYEINAREWKDFGSRNTYNLNQPYIHYTIQSIIDHNQKDFYICLIDDESFSKLIPGWDANVPTMAEPLKTYFRELALVNLLHIYGGMVVPDSFLCTKPLWNFYKDGISAKRPFVCEKTNRTCNLVQQNKKLLFIPDPYFAGCAKNDETMGQLVDFMKNRLLKNDFTEERHFLGDVSQWCIEAIENGEMNLMLGQRIGIKTQKRKTILVEELFEEKPLDLDPSCVGIYIPEDEILHRHKYEWFAYVSKEDVLKVNAIIVKYMRANLERVNNMYYKEMTAQDMGPGLADTRYVITL
jgi:hypothetical protein